MKRLMGLLAGGMMAVALTACTPTSQNSGQRRTAPPAGATQEAQVDGALEKEQMVVDEDPTVTVCIYSVNGDKTGLEQNIDAVDGEELDAQALVNKMIELGVIEEGVTVAKFENKDGALTLELSALQGAKDDLIITAVANTFIQNYEADTLSLTIAGEKIGSGELTFNKDFKKLK